MRVSKAPSPPAAALPPQPPALSARRGQTHPEGVPSPGRATPSGHCISRPPSPGGRQVAGPAAARADGSQRGVRVRVGVLPVAQCSSSSSSSHVNLWAVRQLTLQPRLSGLQLLGTNSLAVLTDVCLLIFTLQTNWLTKRRSTSLLPTSWTRHSANCLATKHCRSALPPPLFLCPAGLLPIIFFFHKAYIIEL